MIFALVSVLAGLAALVVGGEWLVRGAVRLARKAGVSSFVIGLVIVGFGTSMPELVTSVEAAMLGSPAIAWGNVVGSNIANGLLILGATALLAPVAIHVRNRWRDPLVGVLASAALVVLVATGFGSALAGAGLVACLVGYVWWCYREERTFEGVAGATPQGEQESWTRPLVLTLAGLAMLIGGGRLLVTGAIDLARIAGLSETLIGLTIVAIGTSLPEFATSIIAARKGATEVVFGNVVGSNIYNIFGIGGATMLLAPGAVPADLMPIDVGLVAASALVILVLALRRGVSRLSGLALVTAYLLYLALLIGTASHA